MTYEADILVRVTVRFDDNGEDDLRDQAMDALSNDPWFSVGSLLQDSEAELQGDVRPLPPYPAKDTDDGE